MTKRNTWASIGMTGTTPKTMETYNKLNLKRTFLNYATKCCTEIYSTKRQQMHNDGKNTMYVHTSLHEIQGDLEYTSPKPLVQVLKVSQLWMCLSWDVSEFHNGGLKTKGLVTSRYKFWAWITERECARWTSRALKGINIILKLTLYLPGGQCREDRKCTGAIWPCLFVRLC